MSLQESPLHLFRNRGKCIVERSLVGQSTWKEKDPKKRITFMPVVQFSLKLGFTPAFVSAVKGCNWSLKPIRSEEKIITHNGDQIKLTRKIYKNFCLYYSFNSFYYYLFTFFYYYLLFLAYFLLQ